MNEKKRKQKRKTDISSSPWEWENSPKVFIILKRYCKPPVI